MSASGALKPAVSVEDCLAGEAHSFTSHTYHAAKAAEAFAVISVFTTNARPLLTKLATKGMRHD